MSQPTKMIRIDLTYKVYNINNFFLIDFFAQSLQMTNITITPLLSNNEIATGFFGLKLIIRIEAADLYQSCGWLKDGTAIGAIFNNWIPCNNEENIIHRFSCVNMNQVVTATVTFVSPVAMKNSGNYQVQCFDDNLRQFVIAQINIIVMGKTSCYKLR